MFYLCTFLLLHTIGFGIFKIKKCTPASAFLCSICGGTLLTMAFGLVNLLFWGRLLFFICGIALVLFVLYRDRAELSFSYYKAYFNTANCLAIAASLVFLLIYIWQNPHFYYWDEYSFWGYSAKNAVLSNQFFSVYNFHLCALEQIPAGSSALVYLLHGFSTTFHDYEQYFAYTVVTIATFALASEYLTKEKKQEHLAPIIFLIFLLLPFFQGNHFASADYSSLHYAYATAMVDFLMSIYTFAGLLLFFSNKKQFFYLLPLAVLSFTKDVGIIFACLALAIIACFILLRAHSSKKQCFKQIGIVLCSIALMFTCVLAWQGHRLLYQNTAIPPESITTPEQLSFENAPLVFERPSLAPAAKQGNFLQQVLFADYRTQAQNAVVDSMIAQFQSTRSMYLFKDTTLVFLLLLCGFACTIAAPKKARIPLLCCNLGLCAGCILYCLAISLFIANFGDGMVEYPRYLGTYYWIWICFIFTLIVQTLLRLRPRFVSFALPLCALYLTYTVFSSGLDYTVIDGPKKPYNEALRIEERTSIETYQDIFDTNPRVLLITNRFYDYAYMIDQFYMLPALPNANIYNTAFDFSMSFANADCVAPELAPYFIVATDDEFLKIASENFDYIYVTYPQEEFVHSYQEYFNTELTAYSLYKASDFSSTTPFEVVLP